MFTKLIATAFLFLLISCKSNDSSDPNTVNTSTSAKSPSSIEAEKKALNEQSLACIALMNSLEEKQHAAQAAGDIASAKAFGASIDSAATENAKIGQKLMALDK